MTSDVPFVPGGLPPLSEGLLNESERRVHQGLKRLVSMGAAAWFLDACKLQRTPPPHFEAKAHLVFHCLREVESAIRQVLSPIAVVAQPAVRKRNRAGKDPDNQRKHSDSVKEVLKLLAVPEDCNLAQFWISLAGGKQGLHRDAHRDDLNPPRAADDGFQVRFSKFVHLLALVIDRMETVYHRYQPVVDALIVEQDLKKCIVMLSTLPRSEPIQRYLFDKLSDPRWIDVLIEARYFQHPPAPIRDGDLIRFSRWPASEYLNKMAGSVPNSVAPLLARLFQETDNPLIRADILEAACKCEVQLLEALPEVFITWLERSTGLYHHEAQSASNFVAHLLGQQHPMGESALRHFLGPVDTSDEEAGSSRATMFTREPRGRVDAWEFGRQIEDDVLPLATAFGIKGFVVLADVLSAAMRQSGKEEGGVCDDYSYIWRQSLDDSEDLKQTSYRDVLINATIEYGHRLLTEDNTAASEVVTICMQHPWPIHRRIGLHILRLHLDSALASAFACLRDPTVVHNDRLRHEVYWLLRDAYVKLLPDQQKVVLDVFMNQDSSDAIDERAVARTVRRRRSLLHAIEEHLPSEVRAHYDELVGQQPPSPHPDLIGKTSAVFRMGTLSPLGEADIERMTVDELLRYLQSWQPEGTWNAASREGLGEVIANVVARTPGKYSEHASDFIDHNVEYILALLHGLERAVQKQKTLSWNQVLHLLRWVVDHDASELLAREEEGGARHPLWSWAISAAVRLLQLGIREDEKLRSEAHLEKLIECLKRILNDDRLRNYESQWESRGDDHYGQAINMARGVALEALIELGLQTVSATGSNMPEKATDHILDLLDQHLDWTVEPSLALRAVYGVRLGQLLAIRESWVRSRLDRIFPESHETAHYGRATWRAFITHVSPHPILLKLVKEQYRRAIERLSRDAGIANARDEEDKHLGDHLILYYCWGGIDLVEGDLALASYFAKVAPQTGVKVLGSLGRGLQREALPLPPDVHVRLCALADMMISKHPDLCRECGWWFAASVMENPWRLSAIRNLTGCGIIAEPDHLLVETLKNSVEEEPQLVLECLDGIVRNIQDLHSAHGWYSDAKDILRHVKVQEREDLRMLSQVIASRMVARGIVGFEDA